MAAPRIRVLVVDDSAFARKVMREILSAAPDMEVVGTAFDGLDALEKIDELKPDVVTLDLVMPNLDGLGVLGALNKAKTQDKAPRVVVVSMTDEESELGVAALEAGAIDLVHKPTALAVARLYELGAELLDKVRAAAIARAPVIEPRERPSIVPSLHPKNGTRLLVIGASTGGPQALTRLITALPADFPVPVALVLHMPPGYTEAFARRINDESAVEVVEAHNGLLLRPGLVVVGRAGLHLVLDRVPSSDPALLRARLDVMPIDKPHRPSVDILFSSAAAALGSSVLGVVLTGMGDDGLIGARALHQAGSRLITETESSCVVYGMPRVVWEAGLAESEAPMGRMLEEITRRL